MKKRVLATMLIATTTFSAAGSPLISLADEYDQKIQQQADKIDALKNQEAAAQAELDTINEQINSVAGEIDELITQKEALTAQVQKLHEQISELNVRIQKRSVQITNQARNVQVSGTSTNYLDVLLNADSFSDAISRVQGLNTLLKANSELLAQQTEDKEAVETQTKEAEDQVAALEEATTVLEEKEATLATLKIEQEVAKNELQAQRTTEESKKTEYETQKAEAQKKLEEERARQEAAAKKAAEEQKQAEEQKAKALAEQAKIAEEYAQSQTSSEATTTTTNDSSSNGASSIGSSNGVSAAKQRAAQIALSSVGQTNPTGWGQSGECIVAVQNWLNAAGITFTPGGPHSGYVQSGAQQVAWSDVQVGDVVQYESSITPDAWLDGVHTVLVVGVENGVVQIVESNNPAGSGYVSTTVGWTPSPYAANFHAVVWRFPG